MTEGSNQEVAVKWARSVNGVALGNQEATVKWAHPVNGEALVPAGIREGGGSRARVAETGLIGGEDRLAGHRQVRQDLFRARARSGQGGETLWVTRSSGEWPHDAQSEAGINLA